MIGTARSCHASGEMNLPRFSTLGAIDRIGDAFCKAAEDVECVKDIQRYRSLRMGCLSTTLQIMDACGIPKNASVSVRLKRLDSIRRKLTRPQTNFRLGRMDDVIGVRVICQDLLEVRQLSERISSSQYCYRLKDYVSEPAKTGYRAIHHIMSFEQPISPNTVLSVRFEVQVRSFLQHQWAVWSESFGESTKLGFGAEQDQEVLLTASREIAKWENENCTKVLTPLPSYLSRKSLAVCWQTLYGPIEPFLFFNNVDHAVQWLNFLETLFPRDRGNALLLVGVTEYRETQKTLRFTHPLFAGARAIDPRFWINEQL